ncbi:SDR family oxidoreductase [Luteibacter aegosomatissinici]|uniref:SDR family oxidoreductase n=1 Tax=Luteibacter aegosomatissinici TaxID=2911539 RepID=UPI001FFBEF98|nr:SDR family oxidoreductase [Luteibacter aegosomatissinici]UPG92752.1 SDR family oxidoreductase [Luteibacter aegosomatissinici]
MTTAPQRTLLITGGYGVSGTGVVEAALARPGWTPITTGRRPAPETLLGGRPAPAHIQVDLLDKEGTDAAFANLQAVTDVAFCAYLEGRTAADTVAPNVAMLGNTLNALKHIGAKVSRIVLMGGGKSYGAHLGPYKTPAKESDPRHLPPQFFEAQEDALRAWSASNGADWTILRPDGIIGPSLGSPMNILTGMATYAAVCKELGVPFRFPGSPQAWSALHQVTDADLLGRATLWALESDSSRNEIFNITNGDHYRWKHLWPDLARFFDIPVEEPQPIPLAEYMADKGPVWDAIVAKYNLVPTSWAQIAAWPFVQGIVNVGFDLVQSTIKARKAGFGDCIDTHESYLSHLQRLRDARLIP